MADTVPITAGSGTSIATDDIAGVHYQRVKLVHGADGANAGDVSTANGLPVTLYANGLVSAVNSTTANLAGGAAFTGTSEDALEYSTIMVSVMASHASATDGLSLQQSSDGTNWDIVDAYTVPAATGKVFSLGVQARYFRLVYTNGATLTTTLRIQTILSKAAKKFSSQRPQDGRTNDNDLEEVVAFNANFNGTTWDRARGDTTTGTYVGGAIAHDAVDSGNPVKIGARAIAHGANPTAVAASDRTHLYANRHGIPFTLGGHPNIITLRATYAASAQTNAAIVSVSAGTKIVVTQIQVAVSNSTTNTPLVRIGFATATTPTTTGVVFSHPGIPGGGAPSRGDGSGIIGVGADDEDLRITSDAATAGTIDVVVSYFLIES